MIFKKISDCLVFHQSINQDSRLFLNVKEIHQGKKTIDVRYRRGMNVFFFVIFRLYLMNSTSSHSSTLYDNNLSIKHKFYYKSQSLQINLYSILSFFLLAVRELVLALFNLEKRIHKSNKKSKEFTVNSNEEKNGVSKGYQLLRFEEKLLLFMNTPRSTSGQEYNNRISKSNNASSIKMEIF